jgi:hypothetical protein
VRGIAATSRGNSGRAPSEDAGGPDTATGTATATATRAAATRTEQEKKTTGRRRGEKVEREMEGQHEGQTPAQDRARAVAGESQATRRPNQTAQRAVNAAAHRQNRVQGIPLRKRGPGYL